MATGGMAKEAKREWNLIGLKKKKKQDHKTSISRQAREDNNLKQEIPHAILMSQGN